MHFCLYIFPQFVQRIERLHFKNTNTCDIILYIVEWSYVVTELHWKLWWGYKKGKERHKILIHFIQISLFDSLNLQFPVMTAELLLNFFYYAFDHIASDVLKIVSMSTESIILTSSQMLSHPVMSNLLS